MWPRVPMIVPMIVPTSVPKMEPVKEPKMEPVMEPMMVSIMVPRAAMAAFGRKALFRLWLAVSVIMFAAVFVSPAQDIRRGNAPVIGDSTVHDVTIDPPEAINKSSAERFYDSLESRASRSGFQRVLYKTFFHRPARDTTASGKVVDETLLYIKDEGKTIGDVLIFRKPIYDNGNWFEKAVNNLHTLTREYAIRRDLLFGPSDIVDASLIVNNKELLQSRAHISNVDIYLVPHDEDSTVVDAVLITTDQLTLSVDGAWGGSGRTMVEISDASFLGMGDKLAIRTHFNRKKWGYEGNSFNYFSPNMFGTFFQMDARIGREFYDRIMRMTLYKSFILPEDYMLGVFARNERLEYYSLWKDDVDSIRVREFSLWGGKSRYIKSLKSSVYASASYSRSRFPKRPETTARFNPAFHEVDDLLAAAGIYRETFYTANMIYGYGRKEYIASGYMAQFVAGYRWGEFGNYYYLGAKAAIGGFTEAGYFRAEADYGSYFDRHDNSSWMSALSVDLRWISGLWRFRNNNIRQFITLGHTRGWGRGEGDDEILTFTRLNGPRTIHGQWITGRSRTVINSETVFFTPYEPLGFRLAVFGFCDFGLLGNHPNIFNNRFYNTIGIGLRVKNERFIFSTIQVRVGVALTKGGFMHNGFFTMSSEERMIRNRFIPSYPQVVDYR